MPWPDGTPITQEFGDTFSGYKHRGRDAGCPVGTAICAEAEATVVEMTNDGSFGNAVCLDYHNGLFGCHAHNSEVRVRIGENVVPGKIIALSGYSGYVQPPGPAGAHCHFQLCVNTQFPTDISYSRDPRAFLIGVPREDSPMTPTEKAAFDALAKEHDELLLALFSGAEELVPRDQAGNPLPNPVETRKGYARYRLSEFVEGAADGTKATSFLEKVTALKARLDRLSPP